MRLCQGPQKSLKWIPLAWSYLPPQRPERVCVMHTDRSCPLLLIAELFHGCPEADSTPWQQAFCPNFPSGVWSLRLAEACVTDGRSSSAFGFSISDVIVIAHPEQPSFQERGTWPCLLSRRNFGFSSGKWRVWLRKPLPAGTLYGFWKPCF